MVLNKHFREFIALLEKHGVKYLVVAAAPRRKDKIDLEELRRIRDA